ncbi:glycosyl transferase [Streptomyces subrutilus]|uniref:Glycosyl transferase n=1 Tax=Streptomyces subrutilus TaxID=36818 RepID=A0A5P2UDX8_9ACTN|nr:glycosyltransferase [Streptomyces subrutilus]QEU77483.1 glycosyltransferase [Streptomyces subrutilus]GGZ47853.1 glycosyl transferase [Streptomyces subrutilus]
MSRFLFVVPPLVGHVNPAVGVAARLASRGHRVAWVGDPALVRRLAGPDAAVHPSPPGAGAGAAAGPGTARPPDVRGPEALRFLWESFLVPLAEAMAPDVRRAVDAFRADVVVADQQALAGALVAEDLGLPWATSATTSAEFTDVLAAMPRVAAWNEALLRGLRARIGDPAGRGDPRFSPHLVLAFTTPELAGPAARGGDRVRWVGPSLTARPSSVAFPWERLDPGRSLVLVTLGTANTDVGAHFLARAAQALRARADRVQAVVVDPEGTLGGAPGPGGGDPDVIALPAVPQLELLARADAVVCHAGHNTVCEALWHGVPLVVAPIRDDQPVIAAQVADAGAGVRVRFGRAGADAIGAAVDTVLYAPQPRAAARTIARAFRRAGGAPAAARHLERLAEGGKDEA